MVYLPRHDRHIRKKNPILAVIIIAILVVTVIGFYFKREITILFSGDVRGRVLRSEKKVQEGVSQSENIGDSLKDFKKAVSNFQAVDPSNPTALYFEAKVQYLEAVYGTVQMDKNLLLSGCVLGEGSVVPDTTKFRDGFREMYQTAIRARAFRPDFNESDSNNYFINAYEFFYGNKKKPVILKSFNALDQEKLSPEIVSDYIWIGLLGSCVSGELNSLDKFLKKNEEKKEKKIDFSQREAYFLKGVLLFNGNEYVKSLSNLRDARSETKDFITIQSGVIEGMIFHRQNLDERALQKLESVYADTAEKDKTILDKIKNILASKPGLKSKYVSE
ncbi:MAG: hypothetical protein K8R21_04335 [Leptospira sp.]|nr:hypothetical protein [Leptospira sp.]